VSARLIYFLVFASLASAQTVYIYAQRDTPASKWLPITIDGAPPPSFAAAPVSHSNFPPAGTPSPPHPAFPSPSN
jgi:hypothetical protein